MVLMSMIPLAMCQLNGEIDVTFTDIDEVRDHPMSEAFTMSLEEHLQNASDEFELNQTGYTKLSSPETIKLDMKRIDAGQEKFKEDDITLQELETQKSVFPLILKALDTLTDIDNTLEMTVCLQKYGITLNLELQSQGLGQVLYSTVKLASHSVMTNLL